MKGCGEKISEHLASLALVRRRALVILVMGGGFSGLVTTGSTLALKLDVMRKGAI